MDTKHTILVVDDSVTVRSELVEAFLYLGYQTLEAQNGTEAVALVRAHHKDILLMLCDVNMPGMGGLELLDILKTEGFLTDLPVLMITSQSDHRQVKRALMAGAKGWVLKPYRLESVMVAVEGLLKKHRRKGTTDALST